MKRPQKDDYIDIHTHGSTEVPGVYAIENLMAHEERLPEMIPSCACTYGIHPWNLNADNIDRQLQNVRDVSLSKNLMAIGEAGFDKLRGPALELQARAFEEQVRISEEVSKPLFIHCVRSWDELLQVNKKVRPEMPWMVHGFRGNVELARQLVTKGMYLSFWIDFIIRPESAKLLRTLPVNRIFLETDGADIDIRMVYEKVAADLEMSVYELKDVIRENFQNFFYRKEN